MLKKTILIPLIATPIVAVAIVVPAIVFASSKNQTNNSTENNQNNGNNINQEYIPTSGNNMELLANKLSLPTNKPDIENFFKNEFLGNLLDYIFKLNRLSTFYNKMKWFNCLTYLTIIINIWTWF